MWSRATPRAAAPPSTCARAPTTCSTRCRSRPPPAAWVTQDNVNYVSGCTIDNKTFVLLGKPSNKDDCENRCKAYTGCHAYTWHDANQGSYANDCIGRTDGHYVPTQQSGHYSG